MRMEGGEWIQEHRPTGVRLPVVSPFAIDPFARPGEYEVIDPAVALDQHSPGVIQQRPVELVFSLYDPDHVPDAVLRLNHHDSSGVRVPDASEDGPRVPTRPVAGPEPLVPWQLVRHSGWSPTDQPSRLRRATWLTW